MWCGKVIYSIYYYFVSQNIGGFCMGRTRVINVFRICEKMHEAWELILLRKAACKTSEELLAWQEEQKKFLVNGQDVRLLVMKEFEEFISDCEWEKHDIAREIATYLSSGVPLNEVGKLVGLKNSAFRMRVKRITDNANSLLFDGKTCPVGIYSLEDVSALKKCLIKLRLIRNPININEEFTLRQLGWIKSTVEGAEECKIGRENMDSYFKAVLFLALISRTFTLSLLDELDPSVLDYAFKDLQAKGINSTRLLFDLLLKNLSSSSVACEAELAAAKREYQEYTRS